MKPFLLSLGCFLLASGLSVSQHYTWLQTFGNAGDDVGYSVLYTNNSIVVGGWFQQTVTFGSVTLTSKGDDDIFLLRMTMGGEVIWAKRFGGVYKDNLVDLESDDFGNIYFSGFCSEDADFDSTHLWGYGGTDAFLCRINNEGEVLWAISGGGFYNDRAYRLSLSPQGTFLAFTGHYYGPAEFGPYTLPTWGGRDAFIAKIDTSGQYSWVFSSGSDSDESGYGIDIDANGFIYCAGYFFSEFWPVGQEILTNTFTGTSDCSLIKLSPSGAVCFAKSFGGFGDDLPRPLMIDQEFVYIGGYHYGGGNYLGVPVMGHPSDRNSFLLKADTAGNGLWVFTGLSQQDDELIGLTITPGRDLFISGGYAGSIDLGASCFPSHGLYDAYVLRLDRLTGIPSGVKTGGGLGDDVFFGTVAASDQLFVSGFFENTAEFDTLVVTSAGLRDIVLATLDGFISTTPAQSQPEAITLYPNPCQDYLVIDFSHDLNCSRLITVFDCCGKIVGNYKIDQTNKFILDVSSLTSGLYLLKITEEGRTPVFAKVMIQ